MLNERLRWANASPHLLSFVFGFEGQSFKAGGVVTILRYFMISISWIVIRAGIFFITGIPVSRCSRSILYYYSPIVIRRVLTPALVLPFREPRGSDFPDRSTRRHVFRRRLHSASRDYSKKCYVRTVKYQLCDSVEG